MEPILKWAGGKRQLLSELLKIINPETLAGHKFYEPFIGGGCVSFYLEHPRTIINDYNEELINVYQTVKRSPKKLIEKLKTHQERHCKDYYYEVRQLDRQEGYKDMSKVDKAARIIYLNKTCFNGLYRVNSNGYFNVPIGRNSSRIPDVVMEEKILKMSKFLNQDGVIIRRGDFADCLGDAEEGDIIYFDPPYDYEKEGFTSYVPYGFKQMDLERLKAKCDELVERGCIVVLSNNDTQNVRNVFANYEIREVITKRFIMCNGEKRDDVKEVIIVGRR